MNNINENYTILTDVELDNPLCEYFNVNDIIFDFVTKKEDIPLIDQILSKNNNKKILLIVGIDSLIRLCDETSKYNDFLDLINSDTIKLIYFKFADSLFEISGSGPFNFIEQYCKNNNRDMEKIDSILKELKFVWWGDCIFGEYITKHFKNVEFCDLHSPVIKFYGVHHFFHLKKNKEKTNTFFSLIRLHNSKRRLHRNILVKKMENKTYLKNSINNVNSTKSTFSDLESNYGKIHLKNITWPDGLPVSSYYEETYFEVVCETLGAIDGDDTFYLSEKTLKPISMGHPFIILSTKHFLRNLRELGFKTFGDFIDESYDECDRIEDRVEIISKNLERLDMDASRKFYEDSRAIREHNQNHLMYLHGRYKFDLWNKWNNFFKDFK